MDVFNQEMKISPTNGLLRQYVLLIQSSATKVRWQEELLAAGGAGMLAGGGAAIGSLVFPGIGTLIGGGIGLIVGAVYSITSGKKRRQRRYSHVLHLSTQDALKYALCLYQLFDGYLSEIQLRQYLGEFYEEDQ